jgi:two-component system NtrC family sensor kinase
VTEAIFIVDDSLTVRMDLAEAFETAGFKPIPCATGSEMRLRMSRERAALVILDVLLPDADGLELLKELRASPGGDTLPILLLSSEAEVRNRIKGLQTGADDYVGKPYDVKYVVARARELLRKQRPEPAEQRRTILVIDDSATSRAELEEAFTRAGYQVLAAASGDEGLRMAATSKPDAVVVDGVMPNMDGATVIRRMRLDAALRDTPCVLLTASEDEDAELRALDAGADAFVRKGEELELILARVAATLRNRPHVIGETASLLSPKRVLTVDDSPTYLAAISDVLRDEGYDVVLARSGEEAIEMLAVQSVDCILLDLMMPGIDGTETCRRIKASPILRDVPLIMLTSVEGKSAMLQSLGNGADDFVPKSSDFEVLKARVRAQLRRKQFEDEHRRIREGLLKSELVAAEERGLRRVAEARALLVEELERKNQELNAFSYSVSHDLRAPLRGIDGFSQALLEDYSEQLDARGKDYLRRVRAAAQRMGELIDDLLELSRVARAELRREDADLSQIAMTVLADLRRREPERAVTTVVCDGVQADADPRLVRVLLENLLGNAWKFTTKSPDARVEFGVAEREGKSVFFVRDNGAGFDAAYSDKLFSPFQRLHTEAEFPGTGIGLATVHRIVNRHGGRVWAQGEVGKGATFQFTLGASRTKANP